MNAVGSAAKPCYNLGEPVINLSLTSLTGNRLPFPIPDLKLSNTIYTGTAIARCSLTILFDLVAWLTPMSNALRYSAMEVLRDAWADLSVEHTLGV